MAFRRGFKTEAVATADEIRRDFGLGPMDALKPRDLAEDLLIPIWELSEFLGSGVHIQHLFDVEPELFSAVTVFNGPKRTIVHNDAHSPARQASNLAHELAHGLLHHPPTPAIDDKGNRNWNQDIEDEAGYLGGALLVTETATLAIARNQITRQQAALDLGVSMKMIQFRLNCTGAMKRAERSARWKR